MAVLMLVLASTAGPALATGSGSSGKGSSARGSSNSNGNPFAISTPEVTTQPLTTASTASTATTSGNGALNMTDAVLIGVVAVLLFGGIGVFVWRDARRHAPKGGDEIGLGGARSGSKPTPKSRKLSRAERRRRKRGRAR